MKQVEPQLQFEGHAQSQGFRAIQAPDVTPLLRQNMEVEQQNYERARRAGLQDLENQKLSSLADFSQTLSNSLIELGKQKNAADEEAGLMQAYQDGLPQEVVSNYEEGEKQLLSNESQFKTIAASAEQAGAPVDVVRQFRDLGGWKGYGYARGIAEQGAAHYPVYYQKAAANASIVIGDQEITLATAKTAPERAAIEAKIRNGFLSQFTGINPALLNKYLFPAMRQHEARNAVEFSEQQRVQLAEERKAEAQDTLFNGIKSGRGGEAFIEFISRHSGDFGGLGNTRKIGVQILEDMVSSRQITEAEVNNLLGYEFQAKDGSVKKIGEYWGRDFTKLNDLLFNASRTDLQQALTRQQDAQNEFKILFDQKTAERRGEGKDWSEAELRALAADWESKSLGPAPDWLKNAMSKEDRVDALEKDRLLDVRRSRGYLTEEDLRNVSTTLYMDMLPMVKEDKPLAEVPQAFATEAKDKIGAMASQKLNETEGTKDKSPEYYNALYNAKNAYSQYYRENIRTGNDQSTAHRKALERVEANFAVGTYSKKPTSTSDQRARINYAVASKALRDNPNLVNTGVIPGTSDALEQLEQYAKTGKGSIPFIYTQLAQGNRNITAWDIANAQLEAANKGSLMKPKAVEFVDKQDPQIRALLNWRPSASRTARAALQMSDSKQLLDLVASVESKNYGEYDAMNTGGAAGGTVAYGSANSKNVFGRGISQMSIGEVMSLQDLGKIHAAGRYQIIGSTLRSLIQNGTSGLKPTDRFDANNQDRLAAALARRRITSNNAMVGLRNEWIGLRNVSDTALQKAIAAFNNPTPFNQPDNLLPRLVYRIGNRGYGSTGPHLDVKPVQPGTFQTDASLPPLSATELDRYVVVGSKQKPLSQGTVTTDNDKAHRSRNSFGHDFAAPDGTPVFLKNGAQVVGTYKGDGGTDHTIIQLPDGRRYQFLHGLNT